MAASQQSIDAWWAWATGVLNGIGAPTSVTNYQTLWNWSIKESGSDPMNNGSIHNNPLNTKQHVPGSVAGQSGPNPVQSYPDVSSGVSATIATLTNGRYPTIVGNLKQAVPTRLWHGFAAIPGELGTWGSGTNWLSWTNKPPKSSSNFQGNPDPSLASSNSNPVGDAINSAVSAALGPVGTAISNAETNLVEKATYVFLIGVGVLLMLGGFALIAVLALKYVPEPVKGVARTAASVTPAGRVAAVASAAKPKPPATPGDASPRTRTLTPRAQAVVDRAKAGRGGKVPADVKGELS